MFNDIGRGKTLAECELVRLQQEIGAEMERSRVLAQQLGERYAVFRSKCAGYDAGKQIRDTEILRLSKETDECIEAVYALEKRRRQLLEEIGK